MSRPLHCHVLSLLAVLVVVPSALVAPSASAVQPGLRVHADSLLGTLDNVHASINARGVPLSSLTTSGASTAVALEALSSWDFTPAAALAGTTDIVSQQVPVTSAWTCLLPDTSNCGYDWPGVDFLGVSDGLNGATPTRSSAAYEWDEARGLLLARATTLDEGGGSQVKLCFDPQQGRPEVIIAKLANTDADGRYMKAGDPAWSTSAFACVQAANQDGNCSAGGTSAYLDSGTGTTGTVSTRIVKAGTLTLPSGHVLDAILLESLASYTARISCNRFIPEVATIRQWQLNWVVPGLGIVAGITSNDDVATLAQFNTAKSTSLSFGLLPPLSVQVTGTGEDFLSVSWNRGNVARFVDGWEVQWGTASGAVTPHPFSSGALPAGSTSYTIDGLDPGTTYWVSVVARRSYKDPKSNVTTLYRSVRLPTTLGADADGNGSQEHVYPPETSGTTLTPINCVKGDVSGPAGTRDGIVSLADFSRVRQRLANPAQVTAEDRACGDVHPGAVDCQPVAAAANWCVAGDGQLTSNDLSELRRLVARTHALSCTDCAAPPATSPGALRLAGDIAPRVAGGSDGAINVGDVVIALRFSVNADIPTADELVRGNVNPFDIVDGKTVPRGTPAGIDVGDIVTLLRSSVGLEDLAWPERRIAVRLTTAGTFAGFSATVSGWPAWAGVEAVEATGCNSSSGLDGFGELWGFTCELSAPRSGPTDLAVFVYRAAEAIDPTSLSIVASEVAAPGFGPLAGATLALQAQ